MQLSTTVLNYSEVTTSTLMEDAWRKSFVHDSACDACVVQTLADRSNYRGKSRSKFRDSKVCDYCKKPRYIKVDCHALKLKNEKAWRLEQKGNWQQEVNLLAHQHILFTKNSVKSEVFLTAM